jgi:hypothetical protein
LVKAFQLRSISAASLHTGWIDLEVLTWDVSFVDFMFILTLERLAFRIGVELMISKDHKIATINILRRAIIKVLLDVLSSKKGTWIIR